MAVCGIEIKMPSCGIHSILRINHGRCLFLHHFVYLKLLWYKELTLSVNETFSFRLAESYSQLVRYYLDNMMDVDKRLNWQVKEVVWRG